MGYGEMENTELTVTCKCRGSYFATEIDLFQGSHLWDNSGIFEFSFRAPLTPSGRITRQISEYPAQFQLLSHSVVCSCGPH